MGRTLEPEVWEESHDAATLGTRTHYSSGYPHKVKPTSLVNTAKEVLFGLSGLQKKTKPKMNRV